MQIQNDIDLKLLMKQNFGWNKVQITFLQKWKSDFTDPWGNIWQCAKEKIADQEKRKIQNFSTLQNKKKFVFFSSDVYGAWMKWYEIFLKIDATFSLCQKNANNIISEKYLSKCHQSN